MPSRNHNRRNSRKRMSQKSFKKNVIRVIQSQAEKKFLDQAENDTSIVASQPYNLVINGPAQGDDHNQRDGDKIKMAGIRWRGQLALSASATEGASIRFLCLRLPATNVDGTAPIADFTGLLPNDFLPQQVPYHYKVLRDFVVNIGTGAVNKKLIKINLPVKDMLQYDGSASSDRANYVYFVLGLTDHATASELSIDSNVRSLFYDM